MRWGPPRPIEERFEAKVDRSAGPDGCHLWTASRNKKGYGTFGVNGSVTTAHRVVFYFEHGFWPRYCLHSCDNPPCVNVRHLRDGTQADNMADMLSKNRQNFRFKKLNAEIHVEIRRRGLSGETTKALATEYGLATSTVWYIVKGKQQQRVPAG